MEGTDFPSSYPALPRPPYSLFRHVLQLQVVHLQSSPQMQIPPRREDRTIYVRIELEWETQGVAADLHSARVSGLSLGSGRTRGPSITPCGEDHPGVPSPSPDPETGVAASASPGILVKTSNPGTSL